MEHASQLHLSYAFLHKVYLRGIQTFDILLAPLPFLHEAESSQG